MKRKGFTLIELLAVIVIIAVIALITIPIIGNIIEDSRKKSLEQSVKGIIEAANYFAISNDGDYHFVFSHEVKGVATTGENLSYKGSIDATGDLYIDNEGNISLCLMNENYYVYKNYNSGIYVGDVTEDTCIAGYDALTNKYIAMLDDGTGEVSNVYSKEQVDSLVTNLQSQIYSNDTDIEGLNSNVNSLTSMVNSNSENITNLQNSLSSINTQLNTNTTDISNLTSSLETIETHTQYNLANTLGETSYAKPWLELQAQFESLPNQTTVSGFISAGGQWSYTGRRVNTYGTWIVHLYSSGGIIYHVTNYNGTWTYYTFSPSASTTF